jgi:hypothetical protein
MNIIFVTLGVFQVISIIYFTYWTLKIRKQELQFQDRKKTLVVMAADEQPIEEKDSKVQNIIIDVEPILKMQKENAQEVSDQVAKTLELFKEFLSNLQINVTVDIPNRPEAKVTTKVTYLKGLNKQYESIPTLPRQEDN